MTKTEKFRLVVDIIVGAIRAHNYLNKSGTPDLNPIRTIQEMWSEGYTFGERGDDRIWCKFIYEAEKSSSDYWYRRVKAEVLRRVK